MPTAPSLEFFFGVLKCGIRVVLKPSGVESAKQSPRGSSAQCTDSIRCNEASGSVMNCQEGSDSLRKSQEASGRVRKLRVI